MPNEYMPAPEVAEIARQLIARVTQHHELVNCHIEYMFIKKAPKSKGRVKLGCVRLVTGRNAWLVGLNGERTTKTFLTGVPFFLMEISHDEWHARLDDSQKIALVDHELSHCAISYDDETGEPVLSTRGHDVEEFVGVISRNGLWKDDVQQLGIVSSEQLSLALDRIPAQAEGGA
jgi:hypothetical protein